MGVRSCRPVSDRPGSLFCLVLYAGATSAENRRGDIDPRNGVLTVRLDPLPTRRATTAIAELCEHLTATQTRYPGTDLILRYEIKTRP
jgi:hypothetical protein